ncbi:MAG: MFS transporter [Alphaproteobacteria bacterium]|nr:MFS transporter [Alphaproteobacteria bacterium]
MTSESGSAPKGSVPSGVVNPLSAIAIAVVATLGVLYIVSQFLRNSVGVIAPDLAAEMGLSPIELGLLSSIYFFVFAATQLPLGLALDRFGPKLCMLVCIGFTMLGCGLFAVAHDAGGLVAARALLGFGTASFLMAPVALYARWFPPERFSTLAGIQLGLGSLGAIFATAPLAYATSGFGWRMTFLGVGVCAGLIGVLVWLIVTDDPPGVKQERREESFRESIAGIWQVIRTPSMVRVFMAQLATYPSYVLVVGLWGGPYLTHVYGYDLKGRGDILFVAALSQVLGSFMWGPSDRLFGSHKVPVLIGAVTCLIALVMLAALGTLPVPLLLIVFAIVGFSTGMTSVIMSHGRSLVPPHLLGRTITLLNMGAMGGGFLVQFVSGGIINLFPTEAGAYSLDAYRVVFALQAGLVLIGVCSYFGSNEKNLDRS